MWTFSTMTGQNGWCKKTHNNVKEALIASESKYRPAEIFTAEHVFQIIDYVLTDSNMS